MTAVITETAESAFNYSQNNYTVHKHFVDLQCARF